MKKLLLLSSLAVFLTSCTAEPLPSNINLCQSTQSNIYGFDWYSNQVGAYAKFTIWKNGISVVKFENITSNHFEYSLQKGDLFTFSVNYQATKERPEVGLQINRKTNMDLQSGVYNPDEWYNLFEQKTTANGISYNGVIDAKGNLSQGL